MRFATLATACVAALTSVNAQAIDQAYIGVSLLCSFSLSSSLLPGSLPRFCMSIRVVNLSGLLIV